MKKWDIWMEGYRATGEHGTAQLIGEGYGETFDEAVEDYMAKNPDSKVSRNSEKSYWSKEAYENRKSNWNIWACNLFDNEEDARKAFG